MESYEDVEIWKEIPGYEEFYEASSHGRIKSKQREKMNHTKGVWIENERILSPATNRGGYLAVVLSRFKKNKSFLVHRLVAMAFYGVSDLEVNHKDKNILNNNSWNLEYVTHRENISHKFDKSKTSSKRTGVYFNKHAKKWMACITVNKKSYNLGLFDDEEVAAQRYKDVLEKNGLVNRYRR